jgi:fluoride exporter
VAAHSSRRDRLPRTGVPIDPDLAPDDPGEPSAQHRPTFHVHRTRQPRVLALIAGGGLIGGIGRYELELAWVTPPGHFPWATLVINVSGSFLLGLLLTVLLDRGERTRYLRPFLCTGTLGAWTTMSTFVVEVALLTRHGAVVTAVVYLVATMALGMTSAVGGMAIGRRMAAPEAEPLAAVEAER